MSFNCASISWNAKQFVKMNEGGTLNFSNEVQRGHVWDVKAKSLLIDSMLRGIKIPYLVAARIIIGEKKVYDMLDGKQRSSAILEFKANGFKLVGLQEFIYTDEAGNEQEVDLNGLTYDTLPEGVRDRFDSYSLTVSYYDDITQEEIDELFIRLNNGKPLNASDKTRVMIKSKSEVRELAKDELFKAMLGYKAIENHVPEDLVMKSYIMLFEAEPCYDTKVLRPYFIDKEIKNDEVKTMQNVFGMVLDTYRAMDNKKCAKKLLTKTHFLTALPVISKGISKGLDNIDLAEFFDKFFVEPNETYDIYAGSGSAHKESIAQRCNIMSEVFDKWFEKATKNSEEEVETEVETEE